jgi:NSS family neurotransmitter:Na+ symporter
MIDSSGMSHEGGERAKFSGHIGFVLAAAASAVGLGNLWRFPYLASHYGGGIFVLIYIIVAVTFGFSLMIAEIAIGRKTGKSCIHAFGDLARKYRWLGVVCAAIPIIIVAYYFVIGGWVAKWFIETAAGHLSDMSGYAGNYWWDYITGEISGLGDPMIWFFVFAGLCFVCVIRGVERGIERVSKVLMPALLVMIIGISAYNLIALDGIWDGVRFYLSPDINELTGGTFLGAISQVFYSMSLAMGIMITYGSYMRKDVSIENSVRNISLIDTMVAIIAGLMIVPPAYIFGMGDEKGMGLMFEAMPDVFSGMPGGEVIAPIFYLLVLFAALTSAVSLLEAVVSVFSDARNRRRNRSIVLALIVLIPLGILVVLGFGPLMTDLHPFDQGAGILGIFDTVTNSIMMPIAAILTCVFIAVVIKTRTITDEVEAEGAEFRSKRMFEVMIKYVCPIMLSFMLVLGLADMFGIFSVYRGASQRI